MLEGGAELCELADIGPLRTRSAAFGRACAVGQMVAASVRNGGIDRRQSKMPSHLRPGAAISPQ